MSDGWRFKATVMKMLWWITYSAASFTEHHREYHKARGTKWLHRLSLRAQRRVMQVRKGKVKEDWRCIQAGEAAAGPQLRIDSVLCASHAGLQCTGKSILGHEKQG